MKECGQRWCNRWWIISRWWMLCVFVNRWSIITSERSMPLPRKVVLPYEPIAAFEDSIANHLSKILQSDDHNTVISSAKYVTNTSLLWRIKDITHHIVILETYYVINMSETRHYYDRSKALLIISSYWTHIMSYICQKPVILVTYCHKNVVFLWC